MGAEVSPICNVRSGVPPVFCRLGYAASLDYGRSRRLWRKDGNCQRGDGRGGCHRLAGNSDTVAVVQRRGGCYV